jgi:tetratricopeptide (TPR) repeat protein
MAIEGQLSDVGLADIMQLLAVGRKTGCLTVTDRASFGYIYMEDGRVIYANVLNRPDRLGELLVRNQVIDRDELSRAMEEQARQPGLRLGQILVGRGSITEEDLFRFITVQVEEAVYHLFSWERGAFHFEPDSQPEENTGPHVSIHAESLLLEGARRVDEWSMIEKKISSMDLVFAREDRDAEDEPRGGDAPPELSADQERLLAMVDGHRTVQDLVDESGMVEFDVAKSLFGLLQAGFIASVGRREDVETAAAEAEGLPQKLSLGGAYYRAGMFEDAEREYRAVLAISQAEPAARSRLALICLRSGRFQEALDHYEASSAAARESPAGVRNRALALEMLGRNEEAMELLEGLASQGPSPPELLLARAIPLLKVGRARSSWDLLRRFRSAWSGGDPPPLYYAWAILAAAASGHADEALQVGREGVAVHPTEGAILVNLGVVLEAREQGAAAEALYLRAASSSPVPPQAHKNLGDLAYRRGDQAGARAHYERAVRLDPDLGDDIYLKLGNLFHREGDRDLALQHWRRALELNPRNEVVRTNLQLAASSATR